MRSRQVSVVGLATMVIARDINACEQAGFMLLPVEKCALSVWHETVSHELFTSEGSFCERRDSLDSQEDFMHHRFLWRLPLPFTTWFFFTLWEMGGGLPGHSGKPISWWCGSWSPQMLQRYTIYRSCEALSMFFLFIPSRGGPRKQHLPRISISWRNSMKNPTWELQVDGDKPFFLWRTFADLVSSRPVLNPGRVGWDTRCFSCWAGNGTCRRPRHASWTRYSGGPVEMQVCQSLGGGFVHVCTLSFQSKWRQVMLSQAKCSFHVKLPCCKDCSSCWNLKT